MAQSNLRVELGAWIEGTVAKKSNPSQMRKVWTTPAPKGANVKLAVIRAGERGDVHVISLDVSDPEHAAEARTALTLALGALNGAIATATTRIDAPAPKAPKAPPAIVSNPAPANGRDAVIAKARQERAALSVAPTAPKAPAKAPAAPKLDWFADLMSQAGA